MSTNKLTSKTVAYIVYNPEQKAYFQQCSYAPIYSHFPRLFDTKRGATQSLARCKSMRRRFENMCANGNGNKYILDKLDALCEALDNCIVMEVTPEFTIEKVF